MSNVDDLALGLPCEYCSAAPGFWCVTKSGIRTQFLHAGRTDLLRQAWVDGYLQGEKDEKAYAEWRFQNGPFGVRA